MNIDSVHQWEQQLYIVQRVQREAMAQHAPKQIHYIQQIMLKHIYFVASAL